MSFDKQANVTYTLTNVTNVTNHNKSVLKVRCVFTDLYPGGYRLQPTEYAFASPSPYEPMGKPAVALKLPKKVQVPIQSKILIFSWLCIDDEYYIAFLPIDHSKSYTLDL